MCRRSFQSVSRLAVVVVAGLVLAVSCSKSDSSSAPPTSSGEQKPQSGGLLVVDVPAEPNGFDPSRAAFSPSAFEIMKSVIDPLAALDDKGNAKPYLAESITPDDKFMLWTIQLRPNITFHDGTPLDGEAVKANLDDRIKGVVTSGTLLDIADGGVKATGPLTVTVTMDRPWVHFPLALTHQMGFIVSPKSFVDENSMKDIALKPVGTGPFTWDAWNRGTDVKVKKYANYWQKDAAGAQLPYLDQVTFKFTPDPTTQVNDIQNGNANVLISTAPGVSAAAKAAGLSTSEEKTEGSELFAVLYTVSGKTFNDKNLRIAAASAINRDDMNSTLYKGQLVPAFGPTSKESKWGEPATMPKYDPEKAKALVAEAKAAGKPTTVQITVVSNTENTAYAQYMKEQWDKVGFTASVDAVAENAFAIKLVTAAPDVAMFNYWADGDPDQFWHLLSEQTAAPAGSVGLNFPRWMNSTAEQALTEGRGTADEATRVAAYKRVWEELGKDVPSLFLFHTPTTVGWGSNVHGLDTMTLPDGTKAKPFVWGNGFLTRTWLQK